MNQNASAATPKVTAVLVPEAGALLLPCPPFTFAGAAAGLAAFAPEPAGGAAESFGAGGGQVMLPSFTTVVPRSTSSSMLTLMMPSLVLHSSSASRTQLVAYSVLDCLDRRLGGARQATVA